MNITFQIIVYQGTHVLRECIESLLPWGTVIASEGPTQFFVDNGFPATSDDGTNEILRQFNVPTVHGVWREKDEEVNGSIHLVPDNTDFLWAVDCDEIYFQEDMRTIISLLEHNLYDSIAFRFNTFFGLNHVLTGFDHNFENHRIQRWIPGQQWSTHRPPTMIAPDGKPWREHRHLSHTRNPIEIQHYSYCFASQVRMKTKYYESRGGCIPNYFERVWLPFMLGDDAEKELVQRAFDGCHEWLPQRRGPCWAIPFAGKHPNIIEQSMPKLKERFERELAEYR